MAERAEIFDFCTFFGPTPPRGGDEGIAGLRALLKRHGVGSAVTLSTRALFYDARAGNDETRAACAACAAAPNDPDAPTLLPAALLDPRRLDGDDLDARIGAARLLCVFPATQNWPIRFAPLRGLLQALASRPGGVPPLLWEIGRGGDATEAAALLRDECPSLSVIFWNVAGAQLAETLAVTQTSERISVATSSLRGVGEVAAAVAALGAGRVVFGSGAPAHSLGAARAIVRHAALSREDEARVLSGNARRLLSPPGVVAAAPLTAVAGSHA